MALTVMISSVRRGGLGPVRDAVRPLIDALGYRPIRFEDQTAQPVPSRAVCVEMVKQSDIYLLLLGAEYGDPVPDSGRAPTAEEWAIARYEGKPAVVFVQENIEPELLQKEFIREVESYSSGVFRGTFSDTADLLGKLKEALATAAATIQPMRPRRLGNPIAVPWLKDDLGLGHRIGVMLETHVLPVGDTDPIRASSFGEVSRRLARGGRDQGLFSETDPVVFETDELGVAAQIDLGDRRAQAGVRVTTGRVLTIWEELPREILGTVYDEAQVSNRLSRDVRLAAALGLLLSDEVAIAIGLDRADLLGAVTGPNSMTFPFMASGRGPVRLDPTEAYDSDGLARIAPELGVEIAARLTLRLRRR